MVLGIIGVLLCEKPYTNRRSLTQMCIFFALMILTSSKALGFSPCLRQTLFSSTVRRSFPKENDKQCPKLTNQPPITEQEYDLKNGKSLAQNN